MTTTPAPHRPESLTGICAAIGTDLGFNPDWLRVPLAASLLWKPEVTFAVYAALGLLVLASRLIVRDCRRPAARPVLALVAAPAPAPAREEEPAYALAA